jgi:hypothetical protein
VADVFGTATTNVTLYNETGQQVGTTAFPLVTNNSAFSNLIKFEAQVGSELRADELITDRYHGRAVDGASTAAAVWEVVRFYKDVLGNIVRVRYRTNVVWDNRTAGW